MSQKRTNCSGPGEAAFRPAHRNLTVNHYEIPSIHQTGQWGKRNVARGKKFGAPGGMTFLPSRGNVGSKCRRARSQFNFRVA